MKILILLKFNDLTGVSTFWHAVMSNSMDIEFDVYIPCNKPSIIKNKLSEFGNIINEIPNKQYDQIFINYDGQYDLIMNKKSIKKFFVHGLMSNYNIPTHYYDCVYVFGERAFDFIKHDNKILIRNGVDLNRFNYQKDNNIKLEKILIHDSRNNSFLNTVISSACSQMGYYTSSLGADILGNKKIWMVENRIKTSDLVIGYGRSAIESMAMCKPVIIYGINGGDGYVTKDNFFKLLETNFSGWSLRILDRPHDFKVNQIINELQKYNHNDGIELQKLIEKYLDIQLFIPKIFK